MHARDIAMAMYQAAQGPAKATVIYQWAEMKALAAGPTGLN